MKPKTAKAQKPTKFQTDEIEIWDNPETATVTFAIGYELADLSHREVGKLILFLFRIVCRSARLR